MSVAVYSFFEGDKRERLRDHVEYALRTFNEDSRLVKLGSKLDASFYMMLRYAVILHDFGKVLFNQLCLLPTTKEVRQVGGEMMGAQKVSFEGHEILSAWFADRYLEKLVERGLIGSDGKAMVALAVLLHHHPMSLLERARRLENFLGRVARGSSRDVSISEETLKLFYTELSDIVEPLPIKVGEEIAKVLDETVGCRTPGGGRVGGLIREYWSSIWMGGSSSRRKCFLLLTQGLIAADYNAASKFRGEGVSEFAKTIYIYLKHWA